MAGRFFLGALVGALGALAYARLHRRRRRSPGSMPSESTIRLMTRLALKHNAINLSQGFPNESPPADMVLAAQPHRARARARACGA